MTRTSNAVSRRPPSRCTVRCCSARSSFICRSGDRSPISSRNTVPPARTLERAGTIVHRSGEGAAHVSEQLVLDERGRQARAVDDDERRRGVEASDREWRARHVPCRSRTRRGSSTVTSPSSATRLMCSFNRAHRRRGAVELGKGRIGGGPCARDRARTGDGGISCPNARTRAKCTATEAGG